MAIGIGVELFATKGINNRSNQGCLAIHEKQLFRLNLLVIWISVVCALNVVAKLKANGCHSR